MITQTTEQQKCTLRHLTRFSSADCLAAAAKTGLAHRYLHSRQFQRQFQRPRRSLAPSLPHARIPRTPCSMPRTPCSTPRTPYHSCVSAVPFFPCSLLSLFPCLRYCFFPPALAKAQFTSCCADQYKLLRVQLWCWCLFYFVFNQVLVKLFFFQIWFVMPYYKVLNYAVSFFLLLFTKKRNLIEI